MSKKVDCSAVIEPETLASIYMDLKKFLILAGYDNEIDWQSELNFEKMTETDFLRESAWVVLSCGFRESVVRKYFQLISESFFNWNSARKIQACRQHCLMRATSVFKNRHKVNAILDIVDEVANAGIDNIKMKIRSHGVDYLQKFPYIGPVTSYHLAKNLGLCVVKNDRHLLRIASASGYTSPHEMCSKVAGTVGDSLAVIDLVFWRYATLDKDYQVVFDKIDREPKS